MLVGNCNVFAGPHADIDIVSQLDPSHRWQLHVVKNDRGKRTCLLSETGDTLQRAFELLHEKSARAVDQYVAANGFALPPTYRDARLPMNSDSVTSPLDQSEVIALCGSSSSGEDFSDSEDSLDDFSPRLENRRLRRLSRQAAKRSRDIEQPRPTGYFESRMPSTRTGYPSSLVSGSPERSQPRPLVPLGWGGRPLVPPPPPPGPVHFGIPHLTVPPRLNPPPAKLMPVLLNINWLGHGSRKLLVSCVPTKQVIASVSLMHLRHQPRQFQNVTPGDALPAQLRNLRAVVQRVVVRGEPYEVSTFGDDFAGLFSDGKMVIGFDVEVSKYEPPKVAGGDEQPDLGEIIDA